MAARFSAAELRRSRAWRPGPAERTPPPAAGPLVLNGLPELHGYPAAPELQPEALLRVLAEVGQEAQDRRTEARIAPSPPSLAGPAAPAAEGCAQRQPRIRPYRSERLRMDAEEFERYAQPAKALLAAAGVDFEKFLLSTSAGTRSVHLVRAAYGAAVLGLTEPTERRAVRARVYELLPSLPANLREERFTAAEDYAFRFGIVAYDANGLVVKRPVEGWWPCSGPAAAEPVGGAAEVPAAPPEPTKLAASEAAVRRAAQRLYGVVVPEGYLVAGLAAAAINYGTVAELSSAMESVASRLTALPKPGPLTAAGIEQLTAAGVLALDSAEGERAYRCLWQLR